MHAESCLLMNIRSLLVIRWVAFFLFPFCSEMEFDLKGMLPPIQERKTRSPDSLEGSFFVNRSALEHEENGSSTNPSYTELKAKSFQELPPLKGVSSPHSLESGSLTRAGLLPPLFPPGHSQENLNEDKNEQTSAL